MNNKSGKKTIEDILEDKDFKSLRSQKNSISIILTILELVLYFGFISLIAFNRELLSEKISGSITIGIPIAVGVIVLSWILTGVYIYWANTKYDGMVKSLRDKIGG